MDYNAKKKRKKKKKIKIITATSCWMCHEKITHVDYKDLDLIEKFFTGHGKMMNRKRTGVCVQHMNDVKQAVKRAQYISLLPFKVY